MRSRTFAIAGALLATMTLASASARDRDDGEHGSHHRRSEDRGRTGGPIDPAYLKECGACHIAYPPGSLPAASWRALFSGLDRHFGEDANLEPAVREGIERWVVARAGAERLRTGTPSLRVTELSWFRDEHDEVPADAAARPSVRSLANCSACHPGAERWDFDEDRVRIPRR